MFKYLALSVTAGALAASGAHAQVYGLSGERGEVSPDANPQFGVYDVSLATGPSPYVIGVEAGGPLNARRSGFPRGCYGIMTSEPSVVIHIDQPLERLHLFTAGDGDTTLGVLTPDGAFLCDDDGAGRGTNAGLTLTNARAGAYRVWVGSFDNRNFMTRLVLSDQAPFSQPIGEPNGMPRAADAALVALGPTSNPGHVRVDAMTGFGVFLGGMSLYGDNDEECPGHIGLTPSAVVEWDGGGVLSVRANGEADLVMVVIDPDGAAHCSDDSGDVDDRPLASFTDAAAGRYEVHVGTYMRFDRAFPTTLEVANITLHPSEDPW